MAPAVRPMPANPEELRAVLAAIGATPTAFAALIDGVNDVDLPRIAPPTGRSILAMLEDLVAASADLGEAAHAVLGHVPAAEAVEPATTPTAAELETQLRFLREHIISTVEQQGAAVWWTPDSTGRPLVAHAVDLVARDQALLAELEKTIMAIRERQ